MYKDKKKSLSECDRKKKRNGMEQWRRRRIEDNKSFERKITKTVKKKTE